MNLSLAIFTLLSAIAISSIAAYFSIIGLASLFAASFWPVVIMGIVLELGKINAAAWLHRHWHESPFILKSYLTMAVVVLMVITSIGIFGFLSRGHLEQEGPIAQKELQIERLAKQIENEYGRLEIENNQITVLEQQIEARIENEQQRIRRAESRLEELEGIIQTLVDYDKISGPDGARAVRDQQEEERAELHNIISEAESRIANYRTERVSIRTDNSELIKAIEDRITDLEEEHMAISTELAEQSLKLGPIQYVMEFFGGSDPGQAVRIVIFAIMVAFDPIAIALIIAAQWSIIQYRKTRAASESKDEAAVDEEYIESMQQMLEHIEEEKKELKALKQSIETQKLSPKMKEIIDYLNSDKDLMDGINDLIKETKNQKDIEELVDDTVQFSDVTEQPKLKKKVKMHDPWIDPKIFKDNR